MTNTQTLSEKINSFDFWYMMSDSNIIYRKGNEKKSELKSELSNLGDTELLELIPTLSNQAIKFFDIVTPISPEPAPDDNKTDSETLTTEVQAKAPTEQKKSTLSNIMTVAWTLVKIGTCQNISEGLKAAWKAHKLKTALKEGIVYFSFLKSDGKTIRNAIGTLREGNFNYQSKGGTKTKNLQLLSYWDIEKNTFRSCRIDRLISIAA